jgi:SAM-dependent methyltransferase
MESSLLSFVAVPRVASPEPPLVSIVVVCYNQAHYLAEAIDSAIAQRYPSVEILVIDDGSTDDTAKVAAGYAAVRYVHQRNRGLAAARNTGLRMSSGQYIVFLDADDKLLPDAVQAGIDCFREFPDSAFVSGRYRNIFSDGSPAPTDAPQEVGSDHYGHLLEGNYIGMHATVLYRRETIEAAGGFSESLRACEDYELYLRIARRWSIRMHPALTAEYRQHDTNMSKNRMMMLRSVLHVLKRERRYVRDPRHCRALCRGRRVWKDYYGSLLLQSWGESWELVRIARLCPRQTLAAIAHAIRKRLPRRRIRLGSLRRCEPVSRQFGFDRGKPIDRYYIESFLAAHAQAIEGCVLEIGDDAYSRQFGGARITQQEILHVVPGYPGATIVADLANAAEIPSGYFDCVILTQTLHYIFDLHAAIATVHRIVKPGGTCLITLPGISRICRDQQDRESDCWRFTAASAARLLGSRFGKDNVRVRTYGNVLASVAFLEGLASEELTRDELDHRDPDYQLTIAVEARRAAN